jgi:hypothetical protein
VKYASIKVLVLVLASGGSIAACASGTDSIDFDSGAGGGVTAAGTGATSGGGNGGNGGAGGDSTGGTGGSSGSSNADAGPTCIPQCNIDADCQNSCPVAQTGINCCDTATGLCYVASTPICPMPQTDGGTVMPPY